MLPTSRKNIVEMKRNNGSGVYHIIDSNDIQYPVYCDMDINGGGWTLVSTVHERR